MTHEVHFVSGLPCAGKTTLTRALADALGGTAVVVGDLIRAARDGSPASAAVTRAAFEGRAEYPPDWLARILAPVFAEARGPVVLDGAAPLDRVLPAMGVGVTAVLLVRTSDSVRLARLRERRAAAIRRDDTEETFDARTRFHERSLAGTVAALAPPARVFELAGDRPLGDVLRQALSAVVLARHATRRPAVEQHAWPASDDLAARLVELGRLARERGEVMRALDENASRDPRRNRPVLVVKPGHSVDAALLEALLERFRAAGYRPTGAAAWPGEAIADSALAPAHFDLHYLVARWGPRVAPAGRDGLPAYDLLGGERSAADLDAWWHGPPPAARLDRCVWAKERPGGGSVLNGHIPAMVDAWERRSESALALELEAADDAVSWEVLRAGVLGASDPAGAEESSIRGAAYRGRLPTAGPVTLSANLLHLSAGPLEALRERWLWLGGASDDGQPGTTLIDRPGPAGWAYASTERRDAATLKGPAERDG